MPALNKEVDIVRGDTIYDDGTHKFIWLGWEEHEEEGLVQVNQYLIENRGAGVILDPGGVHVFPRVVANVSRYVDLERIEHLFFSHQDPDVSSGVALWLSVTNAKVYISKWWVRFLPHYGIFDMSKIVPIDEGGGKIQLPSGDYLEIIPAHFLHSVANFHVYDPRSKTLFTGDLGAAIFPKGQRYTYVEDFDSHLKLMEGFHRRYLASNSVVKKYLERVSRLNIDVIAPQHGAIIYKKEHIQRFFNWLSGLRCGVDIADEFYK
ncbi:MBL fold metallo-hydrolase [Thermodesulfovibrio sp. 3907-1M]|uniref:MBL fold metallo-hydrolase n=1 Tax=Thermodesulfovibrio autotrophicus TaxID=3118333 RepID=A0AAU8GUT7_9BACT